jgi:hypothetical protein
MDWAAYFRAVGSAVRGMLPLLRDGARVVLHCETRHHRQFEMLLLAPVAAGLTLRRVLLQPAEETHYVLEFGKADEGESAALQEVLALDVRRQDIAVRHEVDEALREVLHLRAEPTEYLWLYAAAMERLGRGGLLVALLEQANFDAQRVADVVHREAAEALERGRRKGHLLRQDLPRLTWTLAKLPPDAVALSDRTELAVYHHLSTNRTSTQANARRVVHALFPGLATPESGWIDECMSSYGMQTRGEGWTLSPEEAIARRAEDHTQAVAILAALGHRFGFKVWISREEQKRPFGDAALGQLLSIGERYASPANLVGGSVAADVDVIWYDGGAAVWLFEVEWSAAFSPAVVGRKLPAKARRFIVLADERIALVERKFARFSWLRPTLESDGWQFLTWSSLATFATKEDAGLDELEAAVGLRPTIERQEGPGRDGEAS